MIEAKIDRGWDHRLLWGARRHRAVKTGVLTAQEALTARAPAGTSVRVLFLVFLLDPTVEALRAWLLHHWCYGTGKRSRDIPTPLYRLRSALGRLWPA